ncbi:MAG: NGG1p interacting factor NIF3 [Elusimicrobia bacterium]|nr:NGG1p interacting factor NIF3 [Elusimicrobiota bacterium]
MKLKDIMAKAVAEGIKADPRPKKEIDRLLKSAAERYKGLKGVEKEIFDLHTLESPYADSRIIWGDPSADVSEVWAGIDVDTSELLMIKKITEKSRSKPVVIAHHPLGRAYTNFYEVMDMQSDVLQDLGVAAGVSDNLTRERKHEVARKVAPMNHMKARDAARILDIPVMNIHTPADNHVKKYLDGVVAKEKPGKLEDLIDLLLDVSEYRISARNGIAPQILTGNRKNRCGKIFVDMTGGTENDAGVLEKLVAAGVSTVVAMHMSEKHYEAAKKANLNVVIAGHMASDNIGLNLILDKIFGPKVKINEFSGFTRVKRDGK